jgi:PelA/Pel-15E family pectate lyase
MILRSVELVAVIAAVISTGCAAPEAVKVDPYATAEAVRTADNMLLYQRPSGGWPKNIDMSKQITPDQVATMKKEKAGMTAKPGAHRDTLDNGATFSQIHHLARVYTACTAAGKDGERIDAYKAAALKGIDYILAAQYDNGGWAQAPGGRGYQPRITFNDNVMANALNLLQDIVEKKPDLAFVDDGRRAKAARAVEKGVECVLKCQIVLDGKRTAWCQQHDEKTFEPRPARAYEIPCLTAAESVDVVRFLMRLDNPSREVIQAVQNAVAWLNGPAKLKGLRQVIKKDASKPKGLDKLIVKDPSAPPLWARFYYIGQLGGEGRKLMDDDVKIGQPIFGDRDGKIYTSLEKISYERRTGYDWFGKWPAKLLGEEYPAWRKKWLPGND